MPVEFKAPQVQPRKISESESYWGGISRFIEGVFLVLGFIGIALLFSLVYLCVSGIYWTRPDIADFVKSATNISFTSSFALFGALVADRQRRTAERKLAFDLYQKRYDFYARLQAVLLDLCIGMQNDDFNAKFRDQRIELRAEATFLFGKEMPELIDALFNAENFRRYARAVLKSNRSMSDEEFDTALREQHNAMLYLTELRKDVFEYFKPYMSFGHYFAHD